MGYLKIPNLYKDQRVLMFRECYALEKIHGTSAHISFYINMFNSAEFPGNRAVKFFSGGAKHETFVALFDEANLIGRHIGHQYDEMTIYGEAYGGNMQAMSKNYGPNLMFVAFDVKIGDVFVNVEAASQICAKLGLDFVSYWRTNAELDTLDKLRDQPSAQALKNGIEGGLSEGIVIRPLEEFRGNNNARIIAKHKSETFQETATPRKVMPLEQQKTLREAHAIAEEWVTEMRLQHVLDPLIADNMELIPENTTKVIGAMINDIEIEATDEIIMSGVAKKTIATKTGKIYNQYLRNQLDGLRDTT